MILPHVFNSDPSSLFASQMRKPLRCRTAAANFLPTFLTESVLSLVPRARCPHGGRKFPITNVAQHGIYGSVRFLVPCNKYPQMD